MLTYQFYVKAPSLPSTKSLTATGSRHAVVNSKVSRDVFHACMGSRGTCHFALGEAGSPGVAHNHFHPSGPDPRQKHSRLLAPFRMGGPTRRQLGRAEVGSSPLREMKEGWLELVSTPSLGWNRVINHLFRQLPRDFLKLGEKLKYVHI